MLLFSLAALLSSCATEGNDKKQDFIVKTTQAVPVLHQGEPKIRKQSQWQSQLQ